VPIFLARFDNVFYATLDIRYLTKSLYQLIVDLNLVQKVPTVIKTDLVCFEGNVS